MKKKLTWKDINLDDVDFIQEAENVYRTKDYIVAQFVKPAYDKRTMSTLYGSEDTYFERTSKRDAEYELIFEDRGSNLEGKRIRTAFFTRKYVK